MRSERHRWRRSKGERGAALVEFALIFPIFMTLVLGMFTGGIAYNQDLSMNHAAREGARYGATLAKEPGGLPATNWRGAVIDRVKESLTGDLDTTKPGHFICVALVTASGSTVWADSTGVSYAQTVGTPPSSVPTNCYTDGLSDTYSRVHILVGRPGEIRTLFYTHTVRMDSKGTARYEGAA